MGIEHLDNILTVQQVAKRKRVSVSAVYKAMKDGRLPVQRVMGRKAILSKDVETWSPAAHGGARIRRDKTNVGDLSPSELLERAIREQRVKPIDNPSELLGGPEFADLPDLDVLVRQWRDEDLKLSR
jgi:excisionase family DNA binding protein